MRPILGRRRFGSGKVGFSLRNFRLHIDQFDELKLDVEEYIFAMADAMAVLHCLAMVDATDVEFVIGSAPSDMQSSGASLTSADIKNRPPGTSTFEMVAAKDFTNREICLWVLDFDACNAIDLNPAGVQVAIKAFMGTEAYCPRPSDDTKDQKLWRCFGQRYIAPAARLKARPNFATDFLNGVEAAVKVARAGRNTTATSAPLSGQGSMSSTGVFYSVQDWGHGQYGGESVDFRGNKRSGRDLNANWRK